MNEQRESSRREFLFLVGGLMCLPLAGMTGCVPEEAEPPPTSDENPTQKDDLPPETPATVPDTAAQETAATDKPALEGGELPRLDESDTMAQALGYKNDASRVDFEQFPSRADADSANHFCRNCVHFQAPPDKQWAPCTIFPGKTVNADGWCSAWAVSA